MGDGKGGDRAILNESTHRDYLKKYGFQTFTEDELNAAKELLKVEAEVVKEGMGHGDLSLESYTQVAKLKKNNFAKKFLLLFMKFPRSGKSVWPKYCSFQLSSATPGQILLVKRTGSNLWKSVSNKTGK